MATKRKELKRLNDIHENMLDKVHTPPQNMDTRPQLRYELSLQLATQCSVADFECNIMSNAWEQYQTQFPEKSELTDALDPVLLQVSRY